MGLFDSVLGAVLNNGQQSTAGADAGAGGLGGLGGLVGMLANNPQLIQMVLGLLSNDGAQGGLGGLIAKFQQAGLGPVIASWIGGGPNAPVSGQQITSALGSGTVADMAGQLGLDSGEVAGQLSQLLPLLVNQLTPQGEAPAQGLGNSDDLMGMLGGLLQGR
ncbi:MAG: YidB family protein [Pseudomonadota bacterium]|nr:YidB family protein [Pseudomonadota bacterium]